MHVKFYYIYLVTIKIYFLYRIIHIGHHSYYRQKCILPEHNKENNYKYSFHENLIHTNCKEFKNFNKLRNLLMMHIFLNHIG